MTNIVERARSKSPYLKGSSAEHLIDELADEIERLLAALSELLSGHDNLYVAHFGPGSNPHDDIAAKPARAALEPKP